MTIICYDITEGGKLVNREEAKLKPEDWIVEDIRAMRSIVSRTEEQEAYLNLLLAYTKMLKKPKK